MTAVRPPHRRRAQAALMERTVEAMSPTAGSGPGPNGPSRATARHVAIVMDGNGRWAKRRGLPRTLGHRAGVNALKRTVEGAADLGLEWLTVFGFSTENWRRPASEVSELMTLLKAYVDSDLARLEREGVRVRVIGRRAGLSADLLQVIDELRLRPGPSFLCCGAGLVRFLHQLGEDGLAQAVEILVGRARGGAGFVGQDR